MAGGPFTLPKPYEQNVSVPVHVLMCFQGVWSMEGQQPGGGKAGQSWRQRRPGSALRSWLPAHHPPAGEAANPPDDYRESNQEIWHPPPPRCHSGRYSGVRRASKPACFTQALMCFYSRTRGTNFTVCCFLNNKEHSRFSGSVWFLGGVLAHKQEKVPLV